jgi:putative ABC transport system substrate-binding protein
VERRAFVAGTLSLIAVPLAGEAQPTRVYHVGVVHQGGIHSEAVEGLREALTELGFEEGKQVVFDVRDTKGDLPAVEAAARALEAAKVDLIVSVSSSTTVAVKRATQSVRIVFFAGTDPVNLGLVESLRRPGGRLTGVHGQYTDLTAKRFELLKELAPGIRRALVFYNPANAAAVRSLMDARAAARQLKVMLVERPVASVDELRTALRTLRPGEVDAIADVSDAMVISQAKAVIDIAIARKLPMMAADIDEVAIGALASYAESYRTIGRLLAKYAQRVLLGAAPGGLPIEQLDRLHLVINLKTAKALGLTIPASVLARADKIIE